MNRLVVSLAALTLAGLLSIPARAQKPATKPALSPSQAVLASWNDIGRKLVAMAEDFPEDKYDFKPVPAQRSFAEQLLHVAGSNDLFTATATGQKPVDDESREHYPTKAAVVAYVKKSFADGAAEILAKRDRGLAKTAADPESGQTMQLSDLAYEAIEHSGEHYGQLVVYYRMANIAEGTAFFGRGRDCDRKGWACRERARSHRPSGGVQDM